MLRIGLAAIVALALAAGGWWLLYPGPTDPKNPQYVLWKAGLNPWEELDDAVGAVTGDAHRDDLVIGKSEADLRSRFGYLRTPHQAGPVLEACVRGINWIKGRALFIRKSWLLIVFKNGVAADLVHTKPC